MTFDTKPMVTIKPFDVGTSYGISKQPPHDEQLILGDKIACLVRLLFSNNSSSTLTAYLLIVFIVNHVIHPPQNNHPPRARRHSRYDVASNAKPQQLHRHCVPQIRNTPLARQTAIADSKLRIWAEHVADPCSHWICVREDGKGGESTIMGGCQWRLLSTAVNVDG
jgi:hypothetical protein